MIRSLRWKFIWIAMLSLLGTMTVLCVSIGVGNHWITTWRADRAISLLHQNGGTFLPPGAAFDPSDFEFQVTPETAFETRYFIVELTEQREVKAVDLEHIAAFDRHSVTETISKVIQAGGSRGYVDYYRFGLFPREDGGSTMIVMDCFLMLQAADNMLRITVIIFLVCALIVFLLLLYFSGRAIRPFAENLERQRQFVTDASHELKTPLSILSADLDLLSDSCGESQWLESARTQITRLDRLIKNLVELARTEETIEGDIIEEFSVTEIAQASVDAFQPAAEAVGKTLVAELAADINASFPSCLTMLSNTVTRRGRSACRYPNTGELFVSLYPIHAKGLTPPSSLATLIASTGWIPLVPGQLVGMALGCLLQTQL